MLPRVISNSLFDKMPTAEATASTCSKHSQTPSPRRGVDEAVHQDIWPSDELGVPE